MQKNNATTTSRPHLVYRNLSLLVEDVDTLYRIKRLHSLRTLAEAVSYLARQYGQEELAHRDPEGRTANRHPKASHQQPLQEARRQRTGFARLFGSVS
jgi:hypothetical protein